MMKYLVFVLTLPLFSMYNNSPAAPELPEYGPFIEKDNTWGLKVGYVGSGIFQRRLELDSEKKPDRILDKLEYVTHQGALTVNLINRMEAYASTGVMQIKVDDQSLRYTTDWEFAFGLGARGILIYWEEALLGVNVSYVHCSPKIDSISQDGRSRNPRGANIHYDEWQVGVAASRQFGWVVPYIGVGFGKATAKIRGFTRDPDFAFRPRNERFKNRSFAVLLLGTSLTPNKYVVANIEGELLGEYGISGSLDFRF